MPPNYVVRGKTSGIVAEETHFCDGKRSIRIWRAPVQFGEKTPRPAAKAAKAECIRVALEFLPEKRVGLVDRSDGAGGQAPPRFILDAVNFSCCWVHNESIYTNIFWDERMIYDRTYGCFYGIFYAVKAL